MKVQLPLVFLSVLRNWILDINTELNCWAKTIRLGPSASEHDLHVFKSVQNGTQRYGNKKVQPLKDFISQILESL